MNLHCPYCQSALFIRLETVGLPYMPEERVESIECDDSIGCAADWEPDGTLRTAGKPSTSQQGDGQ